MKDAAENEKRLLRASRRLLRPLARILLRNGISAKAFQELGRKVFVDVAFEEFRLENKPQTISRVAVITGLNRKEVARLRGSPAPDEADELVWHNRATTVMAAWFTDPDFLDRKGDPLDLPFDGATASFTTLVRKHSGDMQPRAVADELLHSGALETVDDRLRMTRRGYVPASDPGRLIDILGIHTAELVETIDRNMQTDDEERLLQTRVLADNFPASYLPEFNDYSRRLAEQLIESLVRWLRARDRGRETQPEGERVSVGLGLYQINNRTTDESEQAMPSGDADGGPSS